MAESPQQMVVDGKEKAVTTENEMSHSDEHNQNLSKTKNLRIRKLKEGDAPAADASDSKQKKKKNKTTPLGEFLIALPIPTSKAKVGIRKPPSSPNHGGETHCSFHPSSLR